MTKAEGAYSPTVTLLARVCASGAHDDRVNRPAAPLPPRSGGGALMGMSLAERKDLLNSIIGDAIREAQGGAAGAASAPAGTASAPLSLAISHVDTLNITICACGRCAGLAPLPPDLPPAA